MISIIGGGPSGSYLAYLLAREGKEVIVFEEHNEIGRPIQCTGLLISAIKDSIDMSDGFVVNKISKVRVYAPNDDFVDLNLKKPNYVVDRGKFDKHISGMAMKEGARFVIGKRFMDFKDGKVN